MIFIDGKHTEDGLLNDLTTFWPFLKPGGLIICDDLHDPAIYKGEFPWVGDTWHSFHTFIDSHSTEIADYYIWNYPQVPPSGKKGLRPFGLIRKQAVRPNNQVKAELYSQQNNTKELQPLLSIVVTARNDNHGGNLLRRMQIFINGVLAQSKKYKLPMELILVEWNPPLDRPRLAKVLSWPNRHDFCTLRIIEVPPKVHRRYKHSEKLTLYQFIAKNVGIKRARGKFILATNIDILFSDELMRFLASGSLEKGYVYRIDRYDVPEDVPLNASIEEQLEYCQRNVIRINALYGTYNFLTKDILPSCLPPVISFPQLHINACGDFTLMHREHWFALRGYPEFDIYSLHLDTLLLVLAHYAGVKQKILHEPMRIYHIEHRSGFTPEGERRLTLKLKSQAVPFITLSEIENWAMKMHKAKSPIIFNQGNWGLSDENLKENIICSANVFRIERRRNIKKKSVFPKKKNILILSEELPLYDLHSQGKRLYQIVRNLSKSHQVTFFTCKTTLKERYAERLKKVGVNVFYNIEEPVRSTTPPYSISATDIKTLLTYNVFDIIMLTSVEIAGLYLARIRKLSPKSVIVIDTYADAIFKEKKEKQLSIYESADAIITPSESRRQQILKESPGLDVRILPFDSTLAGKVAEIIDIQPKEKKSQRFKIYPDLPLKLSPLKKLTVIFIARGDQERIIPSMQSLILNSDKEISEIIVAINTKNGEKISEKAERNFVKYFIYNNERDLNTFCQQILNDCPSPYFGIIESDVIVSPHWDKRLIAHLEKDQKALAVCPVIEIFSYPSMYDFESAAWRIYEKNKDMHSFCKYIENSCIVFKMDAIKGKNYTYISSILKTLRGDAKVLLAKDTLVARMKPSLMVQMPRVYFKRNESKLVSVVIPTYNNKNALLKSLYSFFNQSLESGQFEVIIVDAGSEDGTIELMQGLKHFCGFKYFVHPSKRKADAVNFAITEASGRFILVSSPNVIAKQDLITQCLKWYEQNEHENIAIIGETLPQGEDSPVEILLSIFDYKGFCPQNLFLPRKTFKEVGVFDESLEYLWQEVEFPLRLQTKGYKIVYDRNLLSYLSIENQNLESLCKRVIVTGNEFIKIIYSHPNIKPSLIEETKEKVLKYFTGKKTLLKFIKNVIRDLEKFPKDKQDSYKFGIIPLLVACYKILLDFHYYDSVSKKISEFEGRNWLQTFIDKKKINEEKYKKSFLGLRYLIEASLHRGNGTFEAAIMLAQKAEKLIGEISIFPKYLLGSCYLSLGKYREAENEFIKIVNANNKSFPFPEIQRNNIVSSYLYLALSCMHQGDYLKAIRGVTKGIYDRIPLFPKEKALIYEYLSKCYKKMGKKEEAHIFEHYANEFRKEGEALMALP